jgi:acetyl-CoA C-acetyltransferase
MTARPDIAVLGMARTPFGRFGGGLRDVDVRDLGAAAIATALARAGVDATSVDEVVLGVNFPGSRRSIARQAALRAGLPEAVNAVSVDRACCSSLAAARLAARGIMTGDTAVSVCGGAENLSQVPYFLEGARFGTRIGPIVMEDNLVISCPHTGVPRAVQAADEALSYGITREQQDMWAVRSHELYFAADDGARSEEIFPVSGATLPGATGLDTDESPRPDASYARLAELPTVYGSATVTAGNSPGLSTGSSALVLASEARAAALGSAPLAHLIAFAAASGPAPRIGHTPAVAARLALARAGLDLDQIDVIEINEAFAAVPLVATLELADGDQSRAELSRSGTPRVPAGHGWSWP